MKDVYLWGRLGGLGTNKARMEWEEMVHNIAFL